MKKVQLWQRLQLNMRIFSRKKFHTPQYPKSNETIQLDNYDDAIVLAVLPKKLGMGTELGNGENNKQPAPA